MTIRIYDLANGILQFETEATTPEDAWKAFGEHLGYECEEPGVFEKSAYLWTRREIIQDVSECERF